MEYIDLTLQEGGSGVSDYDLLTNQPQINGVTLTGNKTTADLGIQDARILPDNYTIRVATDGTGDFTDIQSALNSLSGKVCAGKIYVVLKSGDTFTINNPITIPNNIVCSCLEITGDNGSSPNTTTIQTTTATELFNISTLSTSAPIHFYKLNFIGNNDLSSDTSCIKAYRYAGRIHVENCSFQKVQFGLEGVISTNWLVNNCTATNCKFGVAFNSSYAYIRDFTVSDCTTAVMANNGGYVMARGTLTKTNTTNTFSMSKNTITSDGIILSTWT